MAVRITRDARRQFETLPRDIQRRVTLVIERLHEWPDVSGAKPLRGSLAGHYRIRTGDYRVQFHVKGVGVVIEKVGNRDRFYDE
jgi:mRNA-degrading endonuclease RelE of RelBE toxin-antitoxin system